MRLPVLLKVLYPDRRGMVPCVPVRLSPWSALVGRLLHLLLAFQAVQRVSARCSWHFLPSVPHWLGLPKEAGCSGTQALWDSVPAPLGLQACVTMPALLQSLLFLWFWLYCVPFPFWILWLGCSSRPTIVLLPSTCLAHACVPFSSSPCSIGLGSVCSFVLCWLETGSQCIALANLELTT